MENPVHSSVKSLQQLVAILTGLAITTGAIVLIADGTFANIHSIQSIDGQYTYLYIVLLLSVIRFYLGNTRLLDECYMLGGIQDRPMELSRHNVLAADYFAIAFTGIMFAVLSFYVRQPVEFCALFSVILVLDIVWSTLTDKDTADAAVRRARKWWWRNNIAHVVPLIWLLSSGRQGYWFTAAQALMLTNTLADFCLSRGFYFPRIARRTA